MGSSRFVDASRSGETAGILGPLSNHRFMKEQNVEKKSPMRGKQLAGEEASGTSERKPTHEGRGASLFGSTKIKAEHVVESGDTLGALALKYYGSAAKEKWMAIYEANKRVIGDNPNLIKPGQRLKIPELG